MTIEVNEVPVIAAVEQPPVENKKKRTRGENKAFIFEETFENEEDYIEFVSDEECWIKHSSSIKQLPFMYLMTLLQRLFLFFVTTRTIRIIRINQLQEA